MDEKALELGKKLKALADQGTGGERVNAQAHLDRLLQKHGLTLADIEAEKEDWYKFKVKKNQMEIFIVIVANVCSLQSRFIAGNPVNLLCTAAQAIEVQAKFDFYWRVYEEELSVFKRAFVMKHKLWANGEWEGREMSEEEKRKHEEAARRARLMALGLKDEAYMKQLEAGGKSD